MAASEVSCDMKIIAVRHDAIGSRISEEKASIFRAKRQTEILASVSRFVASCERKIRRLEIRKNKLDREYRYLSDRDNIIRARIGLAKECDGMICFQ